jgi:hypothetical protein
MVSKNDGMSFETFVQQKHKPCYYVQYIFQMSWPTKMQSESEHILSRSVQWRKLPRSELHLCYV